MERRKFIWQTGLGLASLSLLSNSKNALTFPLTNDKIIPHSLKKGDHIGLIAPGGAVFDHHDIRKTVTKLNYLGFRVQEGTTLRTQHGYLSDTDLKRAEDLHRMFSNPDIKAIIAIRGGSGCARLLPFLDYDLIRSNPKPLIGMSDITALLNAIYHQSNLVTYHGPVGYSTWEGFTWQNFESTIMQGKKTKMSIPATDSKFYTINPGEAEGILVGGNITVLCQLVGTPYFPDMNGKLLFLEDLNEEPYRIDRLITQLKLAGVFDQINGVVLGEFKKCVPEEPEKSLSLKHMFQEHFKPCQFPVFYGGKFGHIRDKWTLPVGIKAKMNAVNGTLELMEPAVKLV